LLKNFVLALALTLPFSNLAFKASAQTFDPNSSGATDIKPADVIIWTPVQALSDGKGRVLVALRLETRDQFTIYKNKLELRGPSGFAVSVASAPPTKRQIDPMGEGETDVYDGGDFEIELTGDSAPQGDTLALHVTSVGCTNKICLFPFQQELRVPLYLSDDASMTRTTSQPASGQVSDHPDSKALSLEEMYAARLKSGSLPLVVLLLVVFIGGIATNLTPCVFPMIPITLRLLAREGHKPLEGTLLYALGIILTYTGLGVLASLSGGVFGVILANKWVNLGFGLVFALLAVTMLGFGNLSRLQNLGASLGSGRASALNSLGMGAGAGLVAAPCTGPIMGALIAYSAGLGSAWQSILLFFLYSLGFALPYVFLGMAANRAKSFKVSARIQVAIKMLFAAAMFGLAAYYLKNTAYEALRTVQGYWKLLAIGLTTVGLIGTAAVLSRATLMHRKSTHLLPTILLGLGLFAAVQWGTGTDLVSELAVIHSEEEGYRLAQAEQKPLIIDGWADWCVACKEMDKTTYRDPAVITLLRERWIFVKLDLTESNEANEALAAKYEMNGLPTVVLIPADGDLKKAKRLAGYTSSERLMEELRSFTEGRK
jgi:thiol:disulfide interchange protein DsbD